MVLESIGKGLTERLGDFVEKGIHKLVNSSLLERMEKYMFEEDTPLKEKKESISEPDTTEHPKEEKEVNKDMTTLLPRGEKER